MCTIYVNITIIHYCYYGIRIFFFSFSFYSFALFLSHFISFGRFKFNNGNLCKLAWSFIKSEHIQTHSLNVHSVQCNKRKIMENIEHFITQCVWMATGALFRYLFNNNKQIYNTKVLLSMNYFFCVLFLMEQARSQNERKWTTSGVCKMKSKVLLLFLCFIEMNFHSVFADFVSWMNDFYFH